MKQLILSFALTAAFLVSCANPMKSDASNDPKIPEKAAEAASKQEQRLKPEELLEKSDDGVTFKGLSGNYRVSEENPADGKYCMEQGGDTDQESVAKSRIVFPVKPDTRYVLRFHSRNTIPVGHVLFRFIQSRKADELAPTNYLDSGWTQISCNMDQWTLSEKEFRTYKIPPLWA